MWGRVLGDAPDTERMEETMRGTQKLGYAVLALLAAGGLPRVVYGADKDADLEKRVRALERKMDQSTQNEAVEQKEQKTISDRINSIEKQVSDQGKTLAEKLGVTIHGLVAVD